MAEEKAAEPATIEVAANRRNVWIHEVFISVPQKLQQVM
jgi:hypothetical protein